MRERTVDAHLALLLLVESAHLRFVKLPSDRRRELRSIHQGSLSTIQSPLTWSRRGDDEGTVDHVSCAYKLTPMCNIALQALHMEGCGQALCRALLEKTLAHCGHGGIHKVDEGRNQVAP